MPGRRRVDDRDVEDGAARAALELGEIPDLAHRHELADSGRRGGQQLEDAAPAEQAGERPRAQLVAQPFLHGPLRIDRQAEEVAVEPHLVVVARALAEQAQQALLLSNLDHDRAGRAWLPPGRARPRSWSAGAALARDEHEPPVEDVLHQRLLPC